MLPKNLFAITFPLHLLASLLLSATAAVSAQQSGGSQPYLRIAVIVDHSLSAKQKSVPFLQVAEVKRLTDMIVDHGGAIGLFPVKARATGGLLRFQVSPPAPKPAPPDERMLKGLSLFQQRTHWANYREKIHTWTQAEAQRRAEASLSLQKFEAQLPAILQVPRTENRSDVYGALARLERFLTEPSVEPGVAVRRALLVCSDLVDTSSGRTYTLTSAPLTAWVFREETPPGKLPGVKPVMFESNEPAVAWIIQQLKSK